MSAAAVGGCIVEEMAMEEMTMEEEAHSPLVGARVP